MEWNGRQYRPAGQLIRNRKPDFQDMMRPYGQKQNNGNVWVPVLSIPGNVPQPSSGPSPFDPSSITGLKLWFDADDTSTLSLSGNLVESWTSKGDVPMVLTATTSVRRPEYITTGGTGSSPALMFFSSSTAANRSLLTQASTSNSFNLTQGYTIFMAQKNVGSKSASGLYGSFGTYFYTFGSTTPSVNQNIQLAVQGNNQENFRTGATTGYQLNYTSPGSGTRFYWTPTPYSFKYIGVDYNDMSPSKFYGQDIYSGSPTLTSVIYPTGVTSYTGKTINGMGIGGTNTAGTPSGLLTAPQEVYEILVYDTKLSTNDANQVMDYLRTKWDYVVDLSNTAIFDATVTGKTNNSNDYFWFSNFNSPISAVGNFYWTTQGMKFLLDGNTDAYFNTGLVTANLGFNYSVSDSGNNIIETATCQKTPTGPILYSAGTYNISIAYDYNCVDPSPTPTPTETITPTPTETITPTPTETYTPTPTPSYTPTMTPSPVPISLTYISNTINTADQSSYTFSSVSTGVGLIVVVVNAAAGYNLGRIFTGATIGGITATVAFSGASSVGPAPSPNTATQALIYAVVTGSTNDIVVNFNGSVINAAISCWRIENYTSTTPFYSNGFVSNSNINSMSLTTSSLSGKNVGIAACTHSSGNLGDDTWTNATERYDVQLEPGTAKITGADFTTSVSGTRTVTCNFAFFDNYGSVFSLAVWK